MVLRIRLATTLACGCWPHSWRLVWRWASNVAIVDLVGRVPPLLLRLNINFIDERETQRQKERQIETKWCHAVPTSGRIQEHGKMAPGGCHGRVGNNLMYQATTIINIVVMCAVLSLHYKMKIFTCEKSDGGSCCNRCLGKMAPGGRHSP